MVISIIGLGLIGGSLSIDLREKGIAENIIGVDKSSKNADDALRIGLVDEISDLDNAIKTADLIIIAIPVDQTKKILSGILDTINDTTAVMDVGSTKEGICKIADHHEKRANFVATHPIAGTENFGPLGAIHGLFNDKPTIICDADKSADFARSKVESLYTAIGMKILNMNSKEHDLHAAYVSHLSHISSFTLGLTVLEIEKSEETIFELAGSGFASTVRLAKSSADMWAPIFEQNSHHLSIALGAYINKLTQFKNFIENNETGKIHDMIIEANDIRRILDGKKLTA